MYPGKGGGAAGFFLAISGYSDTVEGAMFLPLLLAAAALGGIPAGFVRAPALERPASAVAGRPVTVLCTTDYGAWSEAKRDRQLEAANAWGFYDWSNDLVFIHPNGCRILKAEAAGKTLDEPLTLQAGFALTLVHEAMHAAGQRDEATAECDALHRVPGTLVRFFHVKPGKQLRAIMAAAWRVHRSDPPPYRDLC